MPQALVGRWMSPARNSGATAPLARPRQSQRRDRARGATTPRGLGRCFTRMVAVRVATRHKSDPPQGGDDGEAELRRAAVRSWAARWRSGEKEEITDSEREARRAAMMKISEAIKAKRDAAWAEFDAGREAEMAERQRELNERFDEASTSPYGLRYPADRADPKVSTASADESRAEVRAWIAAWREEAEGGGDDASGHAIAAAAEAPSTEAGASSPSSDADMTAKIESRLAADLVAATAGLDRGLLASAADRTAVDSLARRLERAAPPALDLRSSDAASNGDALLGGIWRLLYSSAFGSGSLGGSRPGPPAAIGPRLDRVLQRWRGGAAAAALDNIVVLSPPSVPAGLPAPPTVELTLRHEREAVGRLTARDGREDNRGRSTPAPRSHIPPPAPAEPLSTPPSPHADPDHLHGHGRPRRRRLPARLGRHPRCPLATPAARIPG